MASVSTFKALAVIFVVALFSAVASAQEPSPASSPAPSPDTGAAGSVSASLAMIGASMILSVLAILKQ